MKLFSWFRRREEKRRIKKRVLFSVLFVLAAGALTIASFSSPYVVQLNPEQIQRVTYNAPFTIQFSQMMNRASVIQAFKIKPEIEGNFHWKDGSTLEFLPDRELKIDDEYEVMIDASAKSLWMKTTEIETTLSFLVTGPPYVLYAYPEDQGLITKEQPVTVMFDRPMAFKDIAKTDLIETEPGVKGKFEYLGLSAFQFIPDRLPAKELSIKIPAGLQALDGGVSEEAYEFTLVTPDLAVEKTAPENESERISVDSPIEVHFNHAVDLNEIRPGLNAQLYPSNDLDLGQEMKIDGFFNTEVTYALNAKGEKQDNILVFSPSFPYQTDTDYRFVLRGSGGLGLEEDFELNFRTQKETAEENEEENTEVKEETTEEDVSEQPEETEASTIVTDERKLRWENDRFMDFFVVGQHPRLQLEEPLTENVTVSVCAIPSSQFMRVNSRQGWDDFECESNPKILDPYEEQFGKELNLAEYFKDDWVHGVYFVSLESGNEKLDKIFFIEDASLLLKRSDEDVLVWATDIKSGKAIPEMDIEFFDYTGELLNTGKTDENGIFVLDEALGSGIYVRGKKGDESEEYFAITSESWTLDPLSSSSESRAELIILLNQNVFEPEEILQVKGIWRQIRDDLPRLPENTQVTMTIEDESHNLLIDKRIPMRRNGSFDATVRIPEEAPEGLYYLNISDLNYLAVADPVLIQVRHSEPQVELEWITAKTDYPANMTPTFIVQARYKNGLPASNLKGSYKLYAKENPRHLQEGAVAYSFSPLSDSACMEDCPARNLISEDDIVFDSEGTATLLLSKGKDAFLPADHEYTLELTALPEDSPSAFLSSSFKVHQGEYDLGLGLKHALIELSDPIEFEVQAFALDNSNPLEDRPLEDEKVLSSLIRQSDGQTVYEKTITTAQVPIQVSIPSTPEITEGTYLLRIVSLDSRRNEIRAEKNIHVFSEVGEAISPELKLIADQPKYFVGGRAHLLISEPEASEDSPVPVILTYERDSLLDYQPLLLTQPITRISIPIKEDMMPHFLVRATRFHRGLSPRYSSDDALLEVGNDTSTILVNLTLEPVRPQPGDEVTVHISTTDYQSLPISGVVTLNASENKVNPFPSPLSYFYNPSPKPTLSASNITLSSFAYSAPPITTSLSSSVFSPLPDSVYFNPLITTDEGGQASVTFSLPETLQELNLEVLATKDILRFGHASLSRKINQRLIIKPILPNFVIPGDQTVFGASVKNVSDQEISSRIELTGEGFVIQGDASRNFTLKPGQYTEISFKVLVDISNSSSVSLQFKSEDDSLDTSLPLLHLREYKDLAENGIISDLWSGRITPLPEAYPELDQLKFFMSGSPALLADVYAEAFRNYPYHSTETLAQQLIFKAKSLSADDEDAFDSARALLGSLLKKADPEGAYHFWDERNPDPSLTALVLLAYKQSIDKGLHIDSLLLNRSINYLWESLEEADLEDEDQLFILWVLGLYENYDTERTLEFFEERSDLDSRAQAFLLMNLGQLIQAGQKSVFPLLDRLKSEIADEADSLESSVKTASLMLLALMEDDPKNALIGPLADFIFSQESKLLSGFDPQLALWIFLAFSDYTERATMPSANYIAQLKLNGRILMDQSVTTRSIGEIFENSPPSETLSHESVNDFFVQKEGEGLLYLAAHLYSFLDPKKAQRIEDGLLITQEYYEVAANGDPVPVRTFKKGNTYFSEVEFIVPQDLGPVSLSHAIPAGFRSLATISSLEGIPFESMETSDGVLRFYSTHLPAGVYHFVIPVEAVLSGSYNQLPSRLQALRTPEILGQTEGQTIQILE